MKNSAKILVLALLFVPQVSSAALTIPQANAILSVLMAFGVDLVTLNNVRNILIPVSIASPQTVTTTITPSQPTQNIQITVAPVQLSNVGGIINQMQDELKVTQSYTPKNNMNQRKYGVYSFKVEIVKGGKSVRGTNPPEIGGYVEDTLITMTLNPDDSSYYDVDTRTDPPTKLPYQKYPHGVTTPTSNDWNAGFAYAPTTAGKKIVTFTAQGLTKEITFDVPEIEEE